MIQINSILENNLIILQVIVPFMAAVICPLLYRNNKSLYILNIFTCCALAFSLMLNLMLLVKLNGNEIFYSIGDWPKNIGIEYKTSYAFAYVSLTINFIFLIFTALILPRMHRDLNKTRFGYLYYSLILLYYTGAIGIIATNDIFNLYVFLEIMSLASYAILSFSSEKKSLLASIDYLIIGSIAANFILLAIGVLLYLTGTLNIGHIHEIITTSNLDVGLTKIAISFFITGVVIKIGLLPFNFWMISCYRFTNVGNLIFISGISAITNFCILIKLTEWIFSKYHIFHSNILLCLSLISLMVFSYLNLLSKSFRLIVIYSSFISLSYCIITYIYSQDNLVFKYIISDALNKCALFAIIFELESKGFKYIKDIESNRYNTSFLLLVGLTLLNNAAMPLSINFVNKIHLMQCLWDNLAIISFAAIIISSISICWYSYNIFESLYIQDHNNDIIKIKADNIVAWLLLIVNIAGYILIFLRI